MDPKELSFEESMKQVMKTLPPVIRDYLVQEKYTPVAKSLMTKYGLRIDQGGVLEREIMLLLMGVENPTEFTEALAEEAKLSKQVIDGIVQDVNNLIFVPLRKEEEKGSPIVQEVRPSPTQNVEPQIQPAAPKAEPELTSHFKLENKIPLPPPTSQLQKSEKPMSFVTVSQGSLPPKVFLPRPATLGEVVRSVLAVPKPIENSKLLEDHEEPHIEINQVPVASQGNAARPVVAPENLPGVVLEPVIPEAPIPEVRPLSVFKVEPQMQFKPELVQEVRTSPEFPKVEPQIQKPVSVAPITSYSSDPYREPIDEPPTE